MASPNDHAGFIYLHRSLHSHWIAARAEHLAAWIDLLMLANWKDRKQPVTGGVVVVPRGACLASERFLQKRWKRWGFRSRKMVRTFVRQLEQDGMITRTEKGPRDTMLTICNYDSYQRTEDARGPQRAHTGPTKGPHGAQREEGKEGKKVEEVLQPLLVGLAADGAGERNGTANAKTAPTTPPPVDAVWSAYLTARAEHYRRKRGRLSGAEPRLTESRRATIQTRLKDYPPEDLADAARGIFLSPHHRGENDSGTEFLDFDTALSVNRDRNNVERFRDLYRRKAVKPESRPIPAGAYSPDGRRRMGESGQWEPVGDRS